MALKLSLPMVSIKLSPFLILTLSLFAFKSLSAQDQTDTSNNRLLASLDKMASPGYIVRKSNAVFPEILTGNEEKVLPYIEKFSSKRRNYLVRMYTRGKIYLPKAAAILRKYNLPAELNILLTLESSYNGNAVSKAGAVGYWQITDEVAREYGLKYKAQMSRKEIKKLTKLMAVKGEKKQETAIKKKDERKIFDIATHAAARYLSDRRRNLGENWLLVVASYNCGVGNVWNAIKKSGKRNPTFWEIQNYLPAETRAYVMNFITLNVIFNNYDLFVKNKLSFADEKIMLPDDMERNMQEEKADNSNL